MVTVGYSARIPSSLAKSRLEVEQAYKSAIIDGQLRLLPGFAVVPPAIFGKVVWSRHAPGSGGGGARTLTLSFSMQEQMWCALARAHVADSGLNILGQEWQELGGSPARMWLNHSRYGRAYTLITGIPPPGSPDWVTVDVMAAALQQSGYPLLEWQPVYDDASELLINGRMLVCTDMEVGRLPKQLRIQRGAGGGIFTLHCYTQSADWRTAERIQWQRQTHATRMAAACQWNAQLAAMQAANDPAAAQMLFHEMEQREMQMQQQRQQQRQQRQQQPQRQRQPQQEQQPQQSQQQEQQQQQRQQEQQQDQEHPASQQGPSSGLAPVSSAPINTSEADRLMAEWVIKEQRAHSAHDNIRRQQQQQQQQRADDKARQRADMEMEAAQAAHRPTQLEAAARAQRQQQQQHRQQQQQQEAAQHAAEAARAAEMLRTHEHNQRTLLERRARLHAATKEHDDMALSPSAGSKARRRLPSPPLPPSEGGAPPPARQEGPTPPLAIEGGVMPVQSSSQAQQPPQPPLPGGEVLQPADLQIGPPQPQVPSPVGEELALVVVTPTEDSLMGGEPTGAEELAVAAGQMLDDGDMAWRDGVKRGRDEPAASDSEREPTPHRARGEPSPPPLAQRAHKPPAHAAHKGGKAHPHHPHPHANAE